MHWEKKICFRLTTRRIVGAILMASTVVNVVIVGAAFGAAPTASTPTLTPFVSPTQVQGAASMIPAALTSVNTISTSIPTSTVSPTPTDTPTDLPTLALCILRSDWLLYYVRQGDTLPALARATNSTAGELGLANCLTNEVIYPGQLLYLPRLPFRPFTLTPSVTPPDTLTDTPTNTPSVTPTPTPSITQTDTPTPTITNTPNTPSIFQDPYGYLSICTSSSSEISFHVTPIDPQGIRAVTVSYKFDNGQWIDISMGPDGETYYAWQSLTGDYSAVEVVTYFFIALDDLEDQTSSAVYNATITNCQSPG